MNQMKLKHDEFDPALTTNPLNYYNPVSDKLGSGNTGSVYRATLNGSYDFGVPDNNEVAVKVIPNKDITPGESAATREIKALKAIKNISSTNPNIMTCYGAFKYDNKTHVLFELASSDLKVFMENNLASNVSKDWLVSQFHGLAQSLHDIHTGSSGNSIFHHDIKPANILVCGTNRTLKITDWGCAGVNDLSHHPPGPGSPTSGNKGNPFYIPPECRSGESSRPHDIWSLGCVFLELLICVRGGWSAFHTFREAMEGEEDYMDDWATADLSGLRPKVLEQMGLLHKDYAAQINVIRGMLNVDPAARLKAQAVANSFEL